MALSASPTTQVPFLNGNSGPIDPLLRKPQQWLPIVLRDTRFPSFNLEASPSWCDLCYSPLHPESLPLMVYYFVTFLDSASVISQVVNALLIIQNPSCVFQGTFQISFS